VVEQLRIAARVLALAGYGLCYSAAGALFAWVSFLFVALRFEWKVGEISDCWEPASIVVGFLFGAWLAWRAKRNAFAHVSLLVVGTTQCLASGAYVAKLALHSEGSFEHGLMIGAALWIGATAAIAAVGGICGLAVQALTDSTAPASSSPTFPVTRAA
jgi:hypothetical protein